MPWKRMAYSNAWRHNNRSRAVAKRAEFSRKSGREGLVFYASLPYTSTQVGWPLVDERHSANQIAELTCRMGPLMQRPVCAARVCQPLDEGTEHGAWNY